MKPIKYRLEIYEESFRNDPSVSIEALTPLMAMKTGDEIEPPSNSFGIDTKKSVWKIIAIRHLVWDIAKENVTHSLSVLVETVSRSKQNG